MQNAFLVVITRLSQPINSYTTASDEIALRKIYKTIDIKHHWCGSPIDYRKLLLCRIFAPSA